MIHSLASSLLPFLLIFLLLPSLIRCQTPSEAPFTPCPELLSPPTERLINARPTELAFLYELYDTNFGPLNCIATPLSDKHVLTTSNCIQPNLEAHHGETKIPLRSPATSDALTVLEFVEPLETRAPFRLNSNLKDLASGTSVRILGTIGSGSPSNSSFGFVDMQVLELDKCERAGSEENIGMELNRAFCTRKIGCGPCPGDVGAPVIGYDESNNAPVILGLTIRATRCGRDLGVDVFEGVARYWAWMNNTVDVDLLQGDVEGDTTQPTSELVVDSEAPIESATAIVSASPRGNIEGIKVGSGRNWGWSLLTAFGAFVVFSFIVWVRHRKEGESKSTFT